MSVAPQRKYNVWQPLIIVISIFTLLLIPRLFGDSIPRAGLENGIVASRLVPGETGFWDLTNDAAFAELDEISYMPLGYWMESVAMHIVGDSIHFDVWYSFFLFLVGAVVMFFIWINLGNGAHSFWVPLLLYMAVPLHLRSATANYIEMPVTIFLMLSSLLYVRGFSKTLRYTGHGEHAEMRRLSDPTRHYSFGRGFNMFFVGLLLSLAFMVNGMSVLFPLLLPVLMWCMDPNRKGNWRPFVDLGIIMGAIILFCLILCLIDPGMLEGIRSYWVSRRTGALSQSRSVASHFYCFYQTLVQLLMPMVVSMLVLIPVMLEHKLKKYALYWKYQDELTNTEMRLITVGHACMITGFLGLVPIAFSLRQYDYYTLPSLPYFILGLSCYVVQSSELMLFKLTKLGRTLLSIMGFVLPVVAILMFLNSAFSSREEGTAVSELHRMLPYLEQNEAVGVAQSVMPNSVEALHMRRHKNIVLTPDVYSRHLLLKFDEYYRLHRKNDYVEVELGNNIYHLYECANPDLLGKSFHDRDLPREMVSKNILATEGGNIAKVEDEMYADEEYVDPMFVRSIKAPQAKDNTPTQEKKPHSGTQMERQMIKHQ